MKKRHMIPWPFRLVILLLAAAAVFYVAVVAYVCICEGRVPKTMPVAESYDAIIVLGAQVKPDGNPSVQLSWRLDAAAEAYQKKNVPVVVCGAQGIDEPMTEAEAMKQYLTTKGIPGNDILTDPKSFNTRQNLVNAGALLGEKQGIRRVLIVTSDYHVPRSLALAADLGFEASGLGSPCKPEYWLKNHAREALAWIKYWGMKYLHLPLE